MVHIITHSCSVIDGYVSLYRSSVGFIMDALKIKDRSPSHLLFPEMLTVAEIDSFSLPKKILTVTEVHFLLPT